MPSSPRIDAWALSLCLPHANLSTSLSQITPSTICSNQQRNFRDQALALLISIMGASTKSAASFLKGALTGSVW